MKDNLLLNNDIESEFLISISKENQLFKVEGEKEQLKLHNKVTKRIHLTLLLDDVWKYEHVSAIEGAPDCSSKAHLHMRLKLR